MIEKILKIRGLRKSSDGGGSGGGEELKITDAAYLFYLGRRTDMIDAYLSAITRDCSLCYGMFAECGQLTTIPVTQLYTSNCTQFHNMFTLCGKLTAVPELDTSNGTGFGNMFSYCYVLTTIPELDTSNGSTFNEMFYHCSRLTTIPKLDLNMSTNVKSMFTSCSALTNLYLYNIRKSIQIGSGTSWGHKLTVDSLVHTIKELCTVTTSQTLTIGSANLGKINGLYCKITDSTNEKLTMELCESTDAGAMTLIDYAGEKGWTIA